MIEKSKLIFIKYFQIQHVSCVRITNITVPSNPFLLTSSISGQSSKIEARTRKKQQLLFMLLENNFYHDEMGIWSVQSHVISGVAYPAFSGI